MEQIVVGMADIKVAKAPAAIKTNLGSCIAVCLYSPALKCGGMLHLMLPSAPANREVVKKAKYADTGIPELLRQLRAVAGVNAHHDFVAKIFGGACVLVNVKSNIGQDNGAAVKEILADLGIKIIAQEIGGNKGYKVEFDVQTGKVVSQIFGEQAKEF